MKKILFVVMLTISSMLSFAGVIMTSSNERIEDVTITSETDSAIVYMQDGVEKSIAIEQVSAILYDNGTYKELQHNTSTVIAGGADSFYTNLSVDLYSNAPVMDLANVKTITPEDEYIYTANEFSGEILPHFVYQRVQYSGKNAKKYRYCGGNMILTKKEFGKFLQMNCPEAYAHYKKAKSLKVTAWCLLPLGFWGWFCCYLPAAKYDTKTLMEYKTSCSNQSVERVQE